MATLTKKQEIDFRLRMIKHYEKSLKTCKPEEVKAIKEFISGHNARLNKLLGL